MTTTQPTPDNIDRMLFQVLEETFTAEPWRRAEPVVVINDATGALSAWALERDLPVRCVQDSAGLATAHAPVTGPVAAVPSQDVLTDAATVVTRLARPLEALEELSWQVARWAAPEVVLLAGQLHGTELSFNPVLSASSMRYRLRPGYYRPNRRARQQNRSRVDSPVPRKNTVTVAG